MQLETGRSSALIQTESGTVLSFQVDGIEYLWSEGNTFDYATSHSLGGVPVLFPWANRLSKWQTLIGNEQLHTVAEASKHRIMTDGNNLPLHGYLLKRPWKVVSSTRNRAVLSYTPDRTDEEIWPVNCDIELHVSLQMASLNISLVIQNHNQPLPLACGFHPYFRLAAFGDDVSKIRFDLPLASHIETDDTLLPDGSLTDADTFWPLLSGSHLRQLQQLDDGFFVRSTSHTQEKATPTQQFRILGKDRSLSVSWLQPEFQIVVIYAPGSDFICIEPMTAPTNGWHLKTLGSWQQQWLAPNQSASLGFSISIDS